MTLCPFRPDDESTMLRLLTDPIIGKTYMLPDYPKPEAAIPLFHRMMDLSNNPDRYVRGIYLDGKLIGFMNDPEIQDTTIEVGYVIDPAYHNQGYMTQALTLAIQDLFSKGYTVVKAGAFEGNIASMRVMEKSGMHRIDYSDTIEYRGKNHLCIYYSIEKQE
ncbi:MAG: GNAT family N-acetyltransferase [Oscillospiraceae bacterium]|nr:GNAT family N-acetyltransferase [Oscillospiraceae bacterium]